jgi:hypothetical protein
MADRIAGDAGLRSRQHAILAEQRVDQRRLADIGPADDGQPDRPVLGFVCSTFAGRRQPGLERFIELVHAVAVGGRDRHRLAEAKLEGFIEPGLAGTALGLVGAHDDRLAGAAHDLGELAVDRREPCPGVDQQQTHVAGGNRLFGLRRMRASRLSPVASSKPAVSMIWNSSSPRLASACAGRGSPRAGRGRAPGAGRRAG